jgi:hypothetical protein
MRMKFDAVLDTWSDEAKSHPHGLVRLFFADTPIAIVPAVRSSQCTDCEGDEYRKYREEEEHNIITSTLFPFWWKVFQP